MTSKFYSIISSLSRKPKTQLGFYEFNSRIISNSENSFSNVFNMKNSLYSIWNNKENITKPITNLKEKSFEIKKKETIFNSLIIEDPFKLNDFGKKPYEKPYEKSKKGEFLEKSKEKNNKSLQECIVNTLFAEYEISINRENFIKEFRNFLALKGNEIFPDYKYISKIIKKLEFGEELMQSKTIFKMEWLSVVSLLFYINIVYFKGYQNYSNFNLFLPIDKNKRTLIIEENNNISGNSFKGEIKEDIEELLEKINPNYTKDELEKMKLEEIQKYSKYLGNMIYKEGKVGYVNKTKEELINSIFPEIINEV